MKMIGMCAVSSVGLQPPRDLEAVHAGHHRVEQHDVGQRPARRAAAPARRWWPRARCSRPRRARRAAPTGCRACRRRPARGRQRCCGQEVWQRSWIDLVRMAVRASSWKLRASATQVRDETAVGGICRLRSRRACAGCRAGSPARPASCKPLQLRERRQHRCGITAGGGCSRRRHSIQSRPRRVPSQSSSSCHAHGLEHEVLRPHAHVVVQFLVERVAGHDGHRRVGEALGAHRADGGPAVDAGHGQVHQHRVGPEGGDDLQALVARGGLQQLEAEGLQHAREQRAVDLLVVDDEDAPARAAVAHPRGPGRPPGPRPRRARRAGTGGCGTACPRPPCSTPTSRRPSGRSASC